ncbi:1-deoxy-D-xylulose-5-phosphate reductoisomerase [Pelagibacterales bacterium SAG-MED10]|nr:1-deoxy-D-xylulose-5-phosphate reductoisomerase [Pelagibacterales bacterium SAG-MED10]
MKQKIAILGSTGSIGKNLLEIINKDRNKFEVVLLTANKNHSDLIKQAKKYNVKNLIIKNHKSYTLLKNINLKGINIYNDYNNFNKFFKKKIDYVMSSISGMEGLGPTLNIIKFTKKIAIANKESIICAWNLIQHELVKNKTKFVPVDSEHFSLWYALKNLPSSEIEKVYLTASGGPLLKFSKLKLKNVKLSQALKHPTWKMGKKISIDSCTMMNKVFEVIEAKHLFNLSYKKITVLTHPNSYIHAVVKFKNGLIKIIAHDTTMKIPIFNSIKSDQALSIKTNKLNLKKLNNLDLKEVNTKFFPVVNILKKLPNKISLYETVIVTINDLLVDQFLNKKITYKQLQDLLVKLTKKKLFTKYKKLKPKKFEDIILVKNKVNSIIFKTIKKQYA